MPFSHAQIWAAIDGLARHHGLTPSGLARKAGLDPTTFNKSKRFSADGRARWPSTESLAKIGAATGSSLTDFAALVGGGSPGAPPPARSAVRPVPLLGLAQAGAGGYFDEVGMPAGTGWDEVSFPSERDGPVYALEVSGDSMTPLYRDGDVIIVSPTAQIRRGDKVVAKTRGGEVMVKQLHRRTPRTVELRSLNPEHENRTFQAEELEWIARILWASQ